MLTETPESRCGLGSVERPVGVVDQSGLAGRKDHPNQVQAGLIDSWKANCASNSGPASRPAPPLTAVRWCDRQRRRDRDDRGRENGLSTDHQ